MKTKLSLLALLAAVGVSFYQCGGGTDTPTTTDSGSEPAPTAVPAEETGGGELASGMGTWDDWYTNKTIWVGSKSEFDFKEGEMDGKQTLRANANVADNRVRDLFIAKHIPEMEAGKTYKITLDYRFDSERPGLQENADEDDFMSRQNMKTFNYIQYDVLDGDQTSRRPIQKIEDYPEQPVETTKYSPPETIGDGQFHTIEIEHTVAEGEEEGATLMMIVRFRAENDMNNNWLYLQNFNVEPVS